MTDKDNRGEIEALEQQISALRSQRAAEGTTQIADDLKVARARHAQKSKNLLAAIGVVSAVLACWTFYSVFSDSLEGSDGIEGLALTDGMPVAAVTPKPNWRYEAIADPMTDGLTHFACTTSLNTVKQDRPYANVTARVCIRQSPKNGLDVYLALDGSGQILCRSYDGCTISVRFDEGQQQRFSAVGPSDHSSNMIFVSNAARFLQGVKSADKTLMQIELYQNGTQVIEFDTKELEWPRP